MKSFNVINWDTNSDSMEIYDIMPYLIRRFIECRKKYKPTTIDQFKEFVRVESLSQWWSRCEYEVIIHGFPKRNNDHKLDIYQQVMMNIDTITSILIENCANKKVIKEFKKCLIK